MVDMDFVIDGYGFLLPMNKQITFQEFANLISGYYDVSVPQNKEVCKFLKGTKGHIKRGHIAVQCMYEWS